MIKYQAKGLEFIIMDIYTFLEEESEIDEEEEKIIITDKKKGDCIIMWIN